MVGVSKTRKHRFMATGRSGKEDLRGTFLFTQRVVDIWNMLPEEVVESNAINMFKRHLDRLLERQDTER